MRIAIFASNMRIGGIQRSLYTLLMSEIFSEHSVDLYLFMRDSDYDLSALPPNIKVEFLPAFPYVFKMVPFEIVAQIWNKRVAKIGSYDLAIDYDGYSQECACYAGCVAAKKRVIWVHSDYRERLRYDLKFNVAFRIFRSKYRRFDRIVLVSRGVNDALEAILPFVTGKTVVIPNLINETELKEKARQGDWVPIDTSYINVMSLGRLVATKNVDELLEAFANARLSNPLLRLHIVGDGEMRDELKRHVDRLALHDYIYFWGKLMNPYALMSQMDCLVLCSRFEGQGIVLREAQSFGLKLVFPKRLEKYNEGLKGSEDVVKTLAELKKRKGDPQEYRLADYVEDVERRWEVLLRELEC